MSHNVMVRMVGLEPTNPGQDGEFRDSLRLPLPPHPHRYRKGEEGEKGHILRAAGFLSPLLLFR